MVEVKHITKYYGKNPAVKDVTFNIEDNEILGFLGPNGAGKSTTMNIICGYLPSTSGTVLIDGHDITEDPIEAKKRIGYLPEIPPVYPDMKVSEYLKFCAGIKGVSRGNVKSQVENAIKRLKLEDVSKRLIGNLSKGYRQRVGFAQALLGNPKFLILDEPTVGLDPEQVLEVRELVRDLKKDHSIILSSHILSEISAVCERVVIINHGQIIATDTIDNLEKSMQTTPVLEITAEGLVTDVQNVFSSVKGVLKVSDAEFVRTGCYSYKVTIENDDVRRDILSAFVKNDISVLEIQNVKMNLEDAFVKIINKPVERNKSLKDMLDSMDDESENFDEMPSNGNDDGKDSTETKN